ncbi:hypothetical protein ILUMI_02585 [Ignelater luminosus]|uniref:Uncharacterized protein n=1 Tax=Ignelater luminosus TaxID=2038154 RepID=A0A8K0DHD2_IGNLU|nr:hypothetical protein ILUMI_02585 [Ignelater luminosus]
MEYRAKVALIARDKLCRICVKNTVILRCPKASKFEENSHYLIDKRVLQMLISYHKKYRNLLKSFKGRQENQEYIEKIEEFKLDSKKLFDISSYTDYEEPESVQADSAFIILTNNKKSINDDIEEELETKGPSSKQMRVKLFSVAPAGVSDRRAAIIISAVLREKRKRFLRDKSLNVNKVGETFHRFVKMEDHYILLKEPGNSCIGYVTCETGAADNIRRSILQYLKEINDISALLAVDCDGTVVNTGSKGEMIHLLEIGPKRNLQ